LLNSRAAPKFRSRADFPQQNAEGFMDAYKHKPRQPPAAGIPRRGAQGAGLSGLRRCAKSVLLCANHAQLDGKAANMLAEKPFLDGG
jgi:hypothetical protein